MRIIFDNQPKSREVCKLMSKYVDRNYNVVIWPESITQKDINDMVKDGLDVQDIVNNNTYNGLSANLSSLNGKNVRRLVMEMLAMYFLTLTVALLVWCGWSLKNN